MNGEKITGQYYKGEEMDAAPMPHPMFSTPPICHLPNTPHPTHSIDANTETAS